MTRQTRTKAVPNKATAARAAADDAARQAAADRKEEEEAAAALAAGEVEIDHAEETYIKACCPNVHIGNGQVLRSELKENAKGKKVFVAEGQWVPSDLAAVVIDSGQAELATPPEGE